MKKIAIIGAGGFGREIYHQLNNKNTHFFVEDKYFEKESTDGVPTFPLSKFNKKKYKVIVAIGEGHIRERIVNNLPKDTEFLTYIHPSAQILTKDIKIGEGSVLCAGTIISCNCNIGKHTLLNFNTTIAHDCTMGDYFTTAHAVNISGNCKIGNNVYFGTNSSCKQKIKICDNVVIGMNACIVKDIKKPGIYIGIPAEFKRKIKLGERYL